MKDACRVAVAIWHLRRDIPRDWQLVWRIPTAFVGFIVAFVLLALADLWDWLKPAIQRGVL